MSTMPHSTASCPPAGSGGMPGQASPREIATKLFFRFKIFVVTTIVVTLTTLVATLLVPPTYTATAKLLIKYETENPFFGEIAATKIQIVSGKNNAEMIRSSGLCRSVVEDLQLTRADIARPAYKTLFGYLALPFALFGSRDPAQETTEIAENLKKSIETKTVQKDRTELVVSDELIEVSVPSPNKEKVAAIANKLCEKFIDEYYRGAETEAQRAYDYLTRQAVKVEADMNSLQAAVAGAAAPAQKPSAAAPEFSYKESGDKNINVNPLVENLSNQVARLEVELERLRNIYTENSPEVVRSREELARTRGLLRRNESLEATKSMLNMVRNKRQQAFMTLQLYKNRLIPISIIEAAMPPGASSAAVIVRFLVNGILGLAAGIALGLALVILFTVLDQRIYAGWELEKELGLTVICSIPVIDNQERLFSDLAGLPLPEATSALTRILGKLDLIGRDMGRIILITGPTSGEGKTFLALQIACTLSRDKRTKVLLMDAALNNGGLSTQLLHDNDWGIIDVLKGDCAIADIVRPTGIANLEFAPAGDTRNRIELGFFKKTLHETLADIRPGYDVIVIDASGLLVSPEAALIATEADAVLLAIRAGTTHREPLRNALQLLEQVGIQPSGAVLNFRRFPIPPSFYRSM